MCSMGHIYPQIKDNPELVNLKYETSISSSLRNSTQNYRNETTKYTITFEFKHLKFLEVPSSLEYVVFNNHLLEDF